MNVQSKCRNDAKQIANIQDIRPPLRACSNLKSFLRVFPVLNMPIKRKASTTKNITTADRIKRSCT
jgi:hypothetical protein